MGKRVCTADTAPLTTNGVFLASTLSSETTAAATGTVGVVRRDPMAMLPFIGYHVGDYLQHWLDMGNKAHPDLLPKIFYVNWFRRDADGNFLWPGFGENSRILKWALQRIEGTVDAVRTPLGDIPTPGDLDLSGMGSPGPVMDAVAAALDVDSADWTTETALIDQWYATIGERLPEALRQELTALKSRLGAAGLGRQG